MAATFPGFPGLPPELRNKIWRAALPGDIGRHLYFYRKRPYWCPRRLEESDPAFIKDVGEMAMEFRTDLLSNSEELDVPLVFVNREARAIALLWLEKQGIKTEEPRPGRCLFKRPFDRTLDTLYIPDDKWDEFDGEPYDRMGEPDLVNQNVDVYGEITRIAISETLFMKDDVIRWLPSLDHWWDITVIFVVVGVQPDTEQTSCCWKLECTDGRALVWYRKTHNFEVQQGTGNVIDEDLHTRIEQLARANLEEQHSYQSLPRLEIRPVYIIRA